MFICKKHIVYKKEKLLSPCRGTCKICKKKKVSGYSNPDHISNPFGYLYLIPDLCVECSQISQKCMWCNS